MSALDPYPSKLKSHHFLLDYLDPKCFSRPVSESWDLPQASLVLYHWTNRSADLSSLENHTLQINSRLSVL